MIRFDGEVVLVTGGGRGIGRAISLLFAELGARVAVTYREQKNAADDLADEITEHGGDARAFQVDLISFSQVDVMIERVMSHFGDLNIIVNNAGIWTEGAIKNMDPHTWHQTIGVNLTGVFNVCRAGLDYLQGETNDNIVNISSTAGQRGEARHSHYAASKGGIISFTKSLATELAPDKIRVNAVAPGWVETDMTAQVMEGGGRARLAETIPLGRVGLPGDIAPAVVFLASPQAGFITGEILNVNGGSVLCG